MGVVRADDDMHVWGRAESNGSSACVIWSSKSCSHFELRLPAIFDKASAGSSSKARSKLSLEAQD